MSDFMRKKAVKFVNKDIPEDAFLISVQMSVGLIVVAPTYSTTKAQGIRKEN